MTRLAHLFKSTKYQQKLQHGFSHLLLITVGISMLFPFIYMVSMSFTLPANEDVFPPQLIPEPIWFGNYPKLMDYIPFIRYAGNSLLLSVIPSVAGLLSASLAAFAFARLSFPGRNLIFGLTIATMILPGAVTIVPSFLIFRYLGWIGTYLPLLVPPFFWGGAFSIFLLRQFFLSIPQDYIDAAEVDGATPFHIYWSIFLPLSVPILATLFVLTFQGHWNDLLSPLIFLRNREMFTLTVGLNYLTGATQYFKGARTIFMAGATLTVMPIIFLFLIAQRYFVQSLVISGLKG